MSFQHGLSGLSAAARNLDVIGNNVANANTVGAKSARAEFADMYANSLTGLSASASGIGVTVTTVAQQFSQGDIVSSQNPLDMAINGRGFFRTTNAGTVQYTRNGQFHMDKDGYIVTNQGARLTGYPVDTTGQAANGTPTDLRISTADIPPRATTLARAQLNLDAREAAITGPFDMADPATYHSAMSMSVYDSLGRDHMITLYYRKTAGNTWDVYASADGNAIAGVQTTLNFNTAGSVTSPTGATNITIPVGADAGNNLTFGMNLTAATQYGSTFSTTEIGQDGYGTGRLSGFSADDTGMLIGRYSNGQTRPQGQIVLANFINPQGLVPLGNNAWVESASAGQPTLGAPGSGVLGNVESGALENSNVDMTSELVSMITAQRFYQANAQTIKTHDQILQTIVNLR